MDGNPICPVQTAEEDHAEMWLEQALAVAAACFHPAGCSGEISSTLFWAVLLGEMLGRVFRLCSVWPRDQEVTRGEVVAGAKDQNLLQLSICSWEPSDTTFNKNTPKLRISKLDIKLVV